MNQKESVLKTPLHWITMGLKQFRNVYYCLAVSLIIAAVNCSNITENVFGQVTNIMPAAFGDFNGDELTDLFVLRSIEKGMSLEIMLCMPGDQEPLLRPGGKELRCNFTSVSVTSVVPGNFDGDAHMDVLVSALDQKKTNIYILHGGGTYINCTKEPTFTMSGQPLALDYNQDTIIDLFGEDKNHNRMFWIFEKDGTITEIPQNRSTGSLRLPHSHAYLDLNDDALSDLLITTKPENGTGYEIWFGLEEGGFQFNSSFGSPPGHHIGQSIFLDLELKGKLYHIVPVCDDEHCKNSTMYVRFGDKWHNLNPDFKDPQNHLWGFCLHKGKAYVDTLTLRVGDFNMDGFPDLLATMAKDQNSPQAFLLENIPSKSKQIERTYRVNWDTLSSMNNMTVMAAFFDIYQDGILDVILYGQEKVQAFRNTLDYDANFVKVMVLSGKIGGGNLPGPKIAYRTTTQEGTSQVAVTTQLPQSAHFSLGLPYTIFGLGRTPNFVDSLSVSVAGKSREWLQIIPNSQMVVIPSPPSKPQKWRARLFITPSKMILLSVAALSATCGLICGIIVALYWKERREDRIEKLQEAHKFHFDAM